MRRFDFDNVDDVQIRDDTMILGFSTLSILRNSLDKMLEVADDNGFGCIEFLCEAHMLPKYLLKDKKQFEVFESYDIDTYIHATTVDLNLASLNEGIRKESIKQTKECLDLAFEMGAIAVTTHPGKVGRREPKLREFALNYVKEATLELVEYANDLGTMISMENMPERFSFLCNRVEELENLSQETGCSITIDLGHANTCENPEAFTNISNITYYHLNDNDGTKDAHLSLGEGNLDLNLLKKVDNGIIELNNFDNVLKSKKVIEDVLK